MSNGNDSDVEMGVPEQHSWGKTVLKPRNEGEDLKVAQTVLKRRDRNLEYNAEKAKQIRELVQERKKKPKNFMKSAESFAAKSAQRKRCNMRVLRAEGKVGGGGLKTKKVNKSVKVLFLCRNTYKDECKDATKMLKELRLNRLNAATFVRNTPEMMEKLKALHNYVYWGYPNKQLVAAFLQKQAALRNATDRKKPIVLSDNALVEEHLGDLGMLCVEDVVAEVCNAGEKMEEVLARMCTFRMADHRRTALTPERKAWTGYQGWDLNKKIKGLAGN